MYTYSYQLNHNTTYSWAVIFLKQKHWILFSYQINLKKMDTLERDIENFSSNIAELSALSRSLVEKENFDQENIKLQQAAVEKKYSSLQDLASRRRTRLLETKKLFQFYREADDVTNWMADKMVVASSEDYGQDLEHVEVRDYGLVTKNQFEPLK